MSSRFPKQHSRGAAGRRATVAAGPESRPASSASAWLGDDRLFTPLGHEPGYDYPLLVWLPDTSPATTATATATRSKPFDLGRVMKRVSLRNFVAVQPGIAANESPALGLEEAVWRSIERIRERIAIHPDRVFLVGQGGGGSDAFRIACRHPREFAGVISLGGLFPLDEALFSQLVDVRRLPMLLCCKRSSVLEQASHTDRTLRLFHAAGAALAMRIYPDVNVLSKSVLSKSVLSKSVPSESVLSKFVLSKTVLGDVNRWIMDEVCGTPTAVPSLSTP